MNMLLKTAVGSFCVLTAIARAQAAETTSSASVIGNLKKIDVVASTVPSNGNVNPYGMAQVQNTVGKLISGHILISNFNNSANLQGTGTTIVDIAPDGKTSVFAELDAKSLPGPCPGGIGLTTALVVLSQGWVIVGSLPTTDGTSAKAKAGCLIVLDNMGKPVETFFGSLINGPWDMTAFEQGNEAKLFVTNVLNDTVAANGQTVDRGTVLRLDLQLSNSQRPALQAMTLVANGFAQRTDPAALVLGPTGVALSPAEGGNSTRGIALYVADTLNNRIAVIDRPLDRTTPMEKGGRTLTSGGSLNNPLGLVTTPAGHLLTVNGGDGFITEIAPNGQQIAKVQLDNTGGPPPGAGTLFGLVFDPSRGVLFVDDGTNTLNILH